MSQPTMSQPAVPQRAVPQPAVPQLVQALTVPMAVLRVDEDQDRQGRREGRQQEWFRQPRLEVEMAMA
jgi:hypothetical protein